MTSPSLSWVTNGNSSKTLSGPTPVGRHGDNSIPPPSQGVTAVDNWEGTLTTANGFAYLRLSGDQAAYLFNLDRTAFQGLPYESELGHTPGITFHGSRSVILSPTG